MLPVPSVNDLKELRNEIWKGINQQKAEIASWFMPYDKRIETLEKQVDLLRSDLNTLLPPD